MKQLPLPVQLRASSVLASYYRGSNHIVVEQLLALQSGSRSSAVWLYGPGGVGKTHLLQAMCASAGDRKQVAAYVPLGDTTLHPELLAGCESLNLVCLDDLERAVDRPDWQRAIFRLYTELEDSGGRLLVAADSPPNSIRIDLRDLASRLAASTVLRLQPLSDEEQIAALTLRATQLGLELPVETIQYLMRRLPRDMTTLCDTLDVLDRASLATQRRLTVPFVREVLDGGFR